ncbi:hypothetical protein [Actinoplanes sp. M2I2]|uniref:hypothetical protein n=1 Tax=Actinoplanes sp. M2I2 TaxID=1734444 RepID=UPI002020735C|nr:hypothetical protein [Actinoplanes sp. M2I2]
MDDVADRLDQASDALTALSRDVPTLAVVPGAFAARPALIPAAARPGPGAVPAGSALPDLVGRALHDHWDAVLEARAREASVTAVRLGEIARSVRVTRQHYAATDETAERRFKQEL